MTRDHELTYAALLRTCALCSCLCSRVGHSDNDRAPSCTLIDCSFASSSAAVLQHETHQAVLFVYANRSNANAHTFPLQIVYYLAHITDRGITLEPCSSLMMEEPVAEGVTMNMWRAAALTRLKHHHVPVGQGFI